MPAEHQQQQSEKDTVESNVFRDGCPPWASGTLVLRDEAGNITGYGSIKRKGDSSAEIEIGPAPEAVRFLAEMEGE